MVVRLIDGDALRKAMYHEAFETDTDMQRWESGCWIRYKMFENALDAAPTIDAAPVVRCRGCKVKNEEHCQWWHGVPADEFYVRGERGKTMPDTIFYPKENAEYVRVVRCKNCKWWGDLDPQTDWFYCYCHVLECSTEPGWFCADGERKDDETD